MKFLADMGISPKTVTFLRGMKHDAVHLYDQGLDRLPDSVILEKARDEGRMNVNGYLQKIVTEHGELLEEGAIASVTENRVRIRPLPIGAGE